MWWQMSYNPKQKQSFIILNLLYDLPVHSSAVKCLLLKILTIFPLLIRSIPVVAKVVIRTIQFAFFSSRVPTLLQTYILNWYLIQMVS